VRNCQGAIVGARDAKDELTNGVVLQGERTQVLLETGLITVQGNEQTNRRQIVDGIRLEFASSEARRAYNCDGRITERRDRDDVEAGGQETR
jgi:hypothetical protein